MSQRHQMDLKQALTIAALVLEFEAEASAARQQTSGWVTSYYGLAQVDV